VRRALLARAAPRTGQSRGLKEKNLMKKIYPCLWFDKEAEEAAEFYVSIFKNSTITSVSRYGDVGPLPKGTVMVATFELDGEKFMALNGGPYFKFTEAISMVVKCETQREVDHYWEKLISGGGKPSQCGWLKDKYGLSWQIVPTVLEELMSKGDAVKSNRMMQALLKMTKLDVEGLRKAYNSA
jgi:predicted 3-demethylubiquinone-9 3-methyltransferase (glyoxalase superfamily)